MTNETLSKLREPFPENEIEWRIGRSGKKANGQVWATCLAYVTSRAIMARLDDVCGMGNWKVSYNFIGQGGVICDLSIKCGEEWVTKQDGAEQTDIEAFKGGISSALKRAGAVWGIGRYLYGLEEGFASINPEGRFYAKLKDGGDFKWDPPRLPDWALPAGTQRPPAVGISANQPTEGDGVLGAKPNMIYYSAWAKQTWDEVLRKKGRSAIEESIAGVKKRNPVLSEAQKKYCEDGLAFLAKLPKSVAPVSIKEPVLEDAPF